MSDKFALIAAEQADDHEQQLPVGLMCRALRVSRSGFYDWVRAEPSARAVRRAKLAVHVKAAFVLGRGTYGVRRVHAVLTHSDDPEVAAVSLDLVRTLMQRTTYMPASRVPTRSPPSPGRLLRRPSPTT